MPFAVPDRSSSLAARSDPSDPSALRVALVFASFGGGGLERTMLRLADGLIARGFIVDLVVGEARGGLLVEASTKARIIELNKVPLWRDLAYGVVAASDARRLVVRLELKPLKKLVRRLPPLVRYLRDAAPDAILAAEPRYNAMAVWGRRLSRLDCRIVLSEHNQTSNQDRRFNIWVEKHKIPLLRRAYLNADAIVAVSDGVADDLAAYSGIPRDRISTVYNPVVGPDLLLKAQEPLHHPWFAAGEPPVILGVGRLHPQKDFATLIRAFTRVRARRTARLIIVGAGAPAESACVAGLNTLATVLGVAADVDTPGFMYNPFAYMSRAAAFVLSSVHEGLGNVLIEALACGCPVVSTDCPSGPAEIPDNGRFGPLVPVGDDASMARAIEQVLDEPPPPEHLKARAQLFSVQRAVDRYVELMFDRNQTRVACPALTSETAS